MPDESIGPAAFRDHFSVIARTYAAFRPTYPPELFAHLAALAQEHAVAWDCACGSGQATLGLVPWFERVVATDASAGQLAMAPPHPSVTYHVATAEASALRDGSVDIVTVAQALHWLDRPRFYAEVRRVARPGAVLAAWSYGTLAFDDRALDTLLGEFYQGTVGPYWPPERRLVDLGYRTVDFPFAPLPVPPIAMSVRWSLDELLGYLRSWSAVARYVAVHGRDPVADLDAPLAAAWGAGRDAKRTIDFPLAVRAGRVA